MFALLCKSFIDDYKNTDNPIVRERYGKVISIFSIICNIISVVIKLFIATVTNSVSIRADAYNNISDIGSNVATLIGFKLSNKHPNSDHPYGYGRIEYISGLIVSFLILMMAFDSIKESITKIINPDAFSFTIAGVIVLIISIGIKVLMYYVNLKGSKAINSESLLAAAKDSISDSLTTTASLVGLLVNKFFSLNIDAYIGLLVSLLVLKNGVEVFMGVVNVILGQKPDIEEIKKIEKLIMSHEPILGIHDLMVHDYGPSHKFMTLHAEVDCHQDVLVLHDLIDDIEIDILNEFGILTTIHMDPVDTKDELVNELKVKVKDIIVDYNKEYNIHDFRIVRGPGHTNMVFDVLVPSEEAMSHEEIKSIISDLIKEKLGTEYRCVMNIDHPFI